MDITLIDVALGRKKAETLLAGGRVVNVFTGEIEEKDVLLHGGRVAAVGDFGSADAETVVDLDGAYLLPGLIDAHVHIESSHMTPASFGRAVLEKGTTTVIADPHEIANVAGAAGIDFMAADAQNAPMDIFYMVPSSVPATDKETAGAVLDSAATRELFRRHPEFLGLGEVMNVPGVLGGDGETAAKMKAAGERPLDGHFPLGGGRELAAFTAAGISSDHESVSAAEGAEKLANGMTLLIREGSSARNLETLLPAVSDHSHSRCCFCADDISASDILTHGDMLNCLKKAVAFGMDAVRAVEMATINPARHYGLKRRGAIAPGYLADLVAVGDLVDFEIRNVWKNGVLYRREETRGEERRFGAFRLSGEPFRFPLPREGETRAAVIRAFPGQIITEKAVYPVDSLAKQGVSRLYVAERYGKNGNVGYGLIEGFGLTSGAIASSVAHDSHNLLILANDDDEAMFAAETVAAMGGGMAVVKNGRVLAEMALPVAGLMSDEDVETLAEKERRLNGSVSELGISMAAPFMTLSFMALPVVAKLKLTDRGLFDVEQFDFTPLYF